MRQNSVKKLFFCVFIFLVAFLCCLPAVSRAVQPSSHMPEATDSCEVPPNTTVAKLYSIFQLEKSMKLSVYQADESARPSGCVATGDRAVVLDSTGELIDCILISVKDQPTESSGTSSDALQTVSYGSSEMPQSEPSQQKSRPSSFPEPVKNHGLVLSRPIDVSSAVSLLAGEANRITVFAPDGSARTSGLICTGDRLVLQDENGSAFRTMTVTVLGDLTRCGRPTESCCSLLYSYLTGNISLPADLLAAADINLDHRVDTADLLKIKQMLLEKSSALGN